MTQTGTVLWTPSDARIRATHMHAFMADCAGRYGFAPNYAELHAWSIRQRDDFWREMLQFAAIRPFTPASTTTTGSTMLDTTWFPEMRLNFAAHLLRADHWKPEQIAMQAHDELGRSRSITYAQLRDSVAAVAAAMRAAGVQRGDRVAAYMPNIPETIIAMLAAASLGAIWSSCSPDFGTDGVCDRFGQIEPRLLFTVDGYSYNGKPIDCRDKVRAILERIPSIQQAIIVPFINEKPDLTIIPRSKTWSAFQASSLKPQASIAFEPLPFNHPLYILYSSGTTGVPKCIVHGHGGTLLQHAKEHLLHSDIHPGDTLFYFTTCGWMMWNWLASGLACGATLALYEGSPSHPDMHHLWRFAERVGVTHFGTSPRFLAACEKAGIEPGKSHDLSKLRVVLSTGSPLTPDQFGWTYAQVKPDLQLASISGGTDIVSCFMLGNPILPVRAGEIQCRGLGMDVQAFNEKGESVIGEKGELVCCSPFPSQPVGFWNDPQGEKYRKAYFDYFSAPSPVLPSPDREGGVRATSNHIEPLPHGRGSEIATRPIWHHGDFIEITPHGGIIVYGRSDATLNPGGVRIGTAEIYREVEAIPEIIDSVVVGRNTPDADVEVCLFVVLKPGVTLDATLIKKIKTKIADGTTKRHAPKHVRQVTGIPYTRSGKKVEIAVTRMIHGEVVPNVEALANPEILAEFVNIV